MQSNLVLSLPARPGNPRNSEGAFLTLANGRILFAYSRYVGDSWQDHAPAVIAARLSSDDGRTWSPSDRVLVPNEGASNVMSPSLLRLPGGRIGLFYVLKNNALDCRMRLLTSADEGETWSKPVLCQPASGYFVTNNDRVVRLATGRLLIPSAWHRPRQADGDIAAGIDEHGAAVFFLSDDTGRTWRESLQRLLVAPAVASGLQEPGVIERQDGTLYGWARTTAGAQWEFTSNDGGETWSPPLPSRFHSPCSPLSLKAVSANRWLAVWNDPTSAPPGFSPAPSSWGRTPLALATSRDEGRTWSTPLLMENDPARGFCYTAIHPLPDAILLAYCCGGRGSAVLQDLCVRRLPLSALPD